MDPRSVFCPNEHCTARGLRGQGTMRVHRYKEGCYRCTRCRGTFSATTGTAFGGLRTPAPVVTTVVTLLAHGCPRQATWGRLRAGRAHGGILAAAGGRALSAGADASGAGGAGRSPARAGG